MFHLEVCLDICGRQKCFSRKFCVEYRVGYDGDGHILTQSLRRSLCSFVFGLACRQTRTGNHFHLPRTHSYLLFQLESYKAPGTKRFQGGLHVPRMGPPQVLGVGHDGDGHILTQHLQTLHGRSSASDEQQNPSTFVWACVVGACREESVFNHLSTANADRAFVMRAMPEGNSVLKHAAWRGWGERRGRRWPCDRNKTFETDRPYNTC